MRIAIGGIHLEASTFTTQTTVEADFEIRRGDRVLEALDIPDLLGPERASSVEWIPLVHAIRGASGPMDPDLWDRLEAEIVEKLSDAHGTEPVDGVWLTIHGATNVLGRTGAEERLAAAVRAVVGPDAVLSASMDPHGAMSRELASTIDLVACHRHAPHVDNRQTLARAAGNLITVLERIADGGTRPHTAWVPIPVILTGEHTSTVVEPGTSVFGALLPAIERHGVLDANLYIGFAWGDEPRNHAVAIATGWDEAAAVACAEELARGYWDARHDFDLVVEHRGPIEEAWDMVAAGAPTPVVVSDSGDNVTAGGSGDVTFALHSLLGLEALLTSGRRFLFAGFHDPDALAAAEAAGVGATLELAIGGRTDSRYAPPVRRSWRVERLVPSVDEPGRVDGALLVDGPIAVTVQRARSAYTAPDDPSFPRGVARFRAWIGIEGWDVVVVKNGYQFPSQVAGAGTSFLAITPGGTDLDLSRLTVSNWRRPVFPLDPDATAELAAVVLR